MFAFPIFSGEPPTSGAAWPAEPTNDKRQGYVVLGYDGDRRQSFVSDAEVDKTDAVRKAALYTGVVGALFVLIGTISSRSSKASRSRDRFASSLGKPIRSRAAISMRAST